MLWGLFWGEFLVTTPPLDIIDYNKIFFCFCLHKITYEYCDFDFYFVYQKALFKLFLYCDFLCCYCVIRSQLIKSFLAIWFLGCANVLFCSWVAGAVQQHTTTDRCSDLSSSHAYTIWKSWIYKESNMWKPLRDENRLSILKIYGYTCDRLVREKERQKITSISRSQAWKLEREGKFPPRKTIGKKSCGWLLSDLLWWISQY